MKTVPQNVVTLAMLSIFLFLILSCSKDSDLLLDAVLNDPEVAIEETNGIPEQPADEEGYVIRTFTFSPINDAYLQNDQGHDQSIIRLQEDYRTSFLMFDLSEVNGPITEAVLQFSIDSDEGDGNINIHKGDSAQWTEETLTANNAPNLKEQLANINKSYKVGASEKVVLNAELLSAENTTLVMTHNAGNDLAFASKEHPDDKGPKLVITYKAPEGSPLISQQVEEDESSSPTDTIPPQENNPPQDNTAPETPNTTASTDGAYYVTTSGRASNDGRSEATAWSIEHAFENAIAGDVVYIKAGDYGDKQLVVDNSGTAAHPIKFIGYTNMPGDLVSKQGSTFTYGNELDSKKMPLIKGFRNGTGIFIPEDYIEIENFQITKFDIGVISNGFNCILRNIIVIDQGNQSNYNAYDGFGLQIKGNNSLLENCFVLNMTAEAIRLFDSDNSRINYCSVFADNPSNPTDYYFLLAGGTNNSVVENSYAERMPGLRHGGHGFDLKDLAENNIIRNCTAKRTNFEFNFSGVKNNILTDSFVYGVDTSSANWHASILIANGANNNLIKNMHIQDTWAAIRFMDDDDGYVGPGGDRDLISLGFDNIFESISVKNTNRILNIGSGVFIGAKMERNQFKNCDFSNFDAVAIAYFKSETNLFESCTFTNGNKFVVEVESYSNFEAIWKNCLWSNVNFTPPN